MTRTDLTRVYCCRNHREALLVQLALGSRGIEAVRGAGDPDFYDGGNEDLLEIDFLVPTDRAAEAIQIIEEALRSRVQAKEEGAPWPCPACGEENAASFEFCWKCSSPPVA